MKNWLRRFIRRVIVADVPDEIHACQDCDELSCSGERYENCTIRLQLAAELHARRTSEAVRKPACETGTTMLR